MQFQTLLIPCQQLSSNDLKQLTNFTEFEHNPDLIIVSTLEEKNSISIDQVHELQRNLNLRPFSHDHKVAIIEGAHLLTLPAQQALLKTLEEPPEDTQIILVTPLPNKLLPTILSRTDIKRGFTKEEIKQSELEYDKLTKLKVSECLSLSDNWGKDRASAIGRLNELLEQIRAKSLPNPSIDKLQHQKAVIRCIEQLEKNVNAKLAIDHLLLTLTNRI